MHFTLWWVMFQEELRFNFKVSELKTRLMGFVCFCVRREHLSSLPENKERKEKKEGYKKNREER